MKHYEVNFVDRTVETVESDNLPSLASPWWSVTLLKLDGETESKFVPYGKIHIYTRNITYIKET
jgi:hypothetical protein